MRMLTGTLLLFSFGIATIETADAGDRFPRLKKLFNRNRAEPEPKPELSEPDQLMQTLRTQLSVSKRLEALDELRLVDPRKNADLVPALITSLQRDPSPAVRVQVAEILGKMKTVSQSAGLAMETALAADPDAKVQAAVQTALLQYQLNGYSTPPSAPILPPTGEPSFAERPPVYVESTPPILPMPRPGQFEPIPNRVGRTAAYRPTTEPPIIEQVSRSKSIDAPSYPPVLPPKVIESTPLPLPKTTIPTIPIPPRK